MSRWPRVEPPPSPLLEFRRPFDQVWFVHDRCAVARDGESSYHEVVDHGRPAGVAGHRDRPECEDRVDLDAGCVARSRDRSDDEAGRAPGVAFTDHDRAGAFDRFDTSQYLRPADAQLRRAVGLDRSRDQPALTIEGTAGFNRHPAADLPGRGEFDPFAVLHDEPAADLARDDFGPEGRHNASVIRWPDERFRFWVRRVADQMLT